MVSSTSASYLVLSGWSHDLLPLVGVVFQVLPAVYLGIYRANLVLVWLGGPLRLSMSFLVDVYLPFYAVGIAFLVSRLLPPIRWSLVARTSACCLSSSSLVNRAFVRSIPLAQIFRGRMGVSNPPFLAQTVASCIPIVQLLSHSTLVVVVGSLMFWWRNRSIPQFSFCWVPLLGNLCFSLWGSWWLGFFVGFLHSPPVRKW